MDDPGAQLLKRDTTEKSEIASLERRLRVENSGPLRITWILSTPLGGKQGEKRGNRGGGKKGELTACEK